MCGIAGLLQRDPAAPVDAGDLLRMRERLRHRGPDGEGQWIDGPIGLAHVRLALVDLAGGAQPMGNEDGAIQVVCNGEIYNHAALRHDLQRRGHVLRTRSDTEVLVHLYEEHGAGFLEHLNGPFALALWDGRQRELLLARDRAGMRPLHWAALRGRVAFASEAKALLALPDCPREADPAALASLLEFWAPPPGHSPFRGIHELPPGHLLRIGRDGIPRLQRWWDWTFREPGDWDTRPLPTLAGELRELLTDAVRLQRLADVPVGLYLSGGLDSSAIAATLAGLEPEGSVSRPAFALGFDDPALDESAAQQAAAASLQAPLHRVTVTGDDTARELPRLVWHAETPLVRTAPVAMMRLAGAVRSHGIKAVLSGEGADELFAGYDLFKEAQVRRFMARAPHSRWRGRLLERLYPYLSHAPTGRRSLAAAVWGAADSRPDDPLDAQAMRRRAGQRVAALFHPAWRAQLAAHDPAEAWRADLPPDIGRWPPLSQAQWVEARTLMAGQLLSTQGDRAAMAEAVELRHPFLDHRVMDWAARLPPRARLAGLADKVVLRESLRGRLPDAVRLRPKQPFRGPDRTLFSDAGGRLPATAELLLDDARLARTGWFDTAAVRRLVDKCRSGRAIGFADHLAFVVAWSMLHWHAQFLDGNGLAPGAATMAPDRR